MSGINGGVTHANLIPTDHEFSYSKNGSPKRDFKTKFLSVVSPSSGKLRPGLLKLLLTYRRRLVAQCVLDDWKWWWKRSSWKLQLWPRRKFKRGKHEEKENFFNEAKAEGFELKRHRHETKKSVKQKSSVMRILQENRELKQTRRRRLTRTSQNKRFN